MVLVEKNKKMLYDEFRALEINAVFLISIFLKGPFNAGPFKACPYLTPLQKQRRIRAGGIRAAKVRKYLFFYWVAHLKTLDECNAAYSPL